MFNNLKLGVKLSVTFGILVVILVLVGYVGYSSMNTLRNMVNTVFDVHLVGIDSLRAIEVTVMDVSGKVYKYSFLPDARTQLRSDLTDINSSVIAAIADYRKGNLTENEIQSVGAFDTAWTSYYAEVGTTLKLLDDNQIDQARTSINKGGVFATKRVAAEDGIANLVKIKQDQATAEKVTAASLTETSTWAIIANIVVGTLISIALAFFLTRSLVQPLGVLTDMAQMLSRGEINRDLSAEKKRWITGRKDELGQVGAGFFEVEAYLADMSAAAQRMASGDLTLEFQPRGEKDDLGNAFAEMIADLKGLVSQIAANAETLAAASDQLELTANQAGKATGQIASTIQEVARGATQQTESVTNTATSVEQMSRTIEGVSRGARNQTQAVTRAVDITGQIATAIRQVTQNAEASAQGSAQAAEVARGGSGTVSATLAGMQNIQTKVALSAQKVQEMGERSKQIGVIVETIEDIASQTNLLALNAAIEAARAGEHGKGFAVVADEVRKLAEKSAGATKEIAGLVNEIQRTVAEAVTAMQAGSFEVEQGVSQANQAGKALTEILKAAEQVNRQVSEIAGAARQMGSLSDDLVSATDTVSSVVEENLAASEEMSHRAHEVTQAIENIASVSEENSASVEEVSAAAEEMSAQVQEVTASTHSLANMAEGLQQIIAQFKVSGEGKDLAATPSQMPGVRGNGHRQLPARRLP